MTTKQAQIIINYGLTQYNHICPHRALKMRSPVPETFLETYPISGPCTGGKVRKNC